MAKKKFTVIDAGGTRFDVEAESVTEVFEPQHKVSFFSDTAKTSPIGSFSAPTSWGPYVEPPQ
jgi:hypothetical protein